VTEATAQPLVEPKRGWRRLILALLVFFLLPMIPQMRAMLPIDETALLFIPAMAACSIAGWWAGGRMGSAVIWTALSIFVMGPSAPSDVLLNLARGWALLLAGSFGLVCLFEARRPFFTKALAAVIAALVIALAIGVVGPVTLSSASSAIATEFAKRNDAFISWLNQGLASLGPDWTQMTTRFPSLAMAPSKVAEDLATMSTGGRMVFPALLVLESVAALALAWATYHRLARQRLGAPLAPLREFRFNDQLVWGLIVGLVIMLLPNLAALRGFGINLILFFGALYLLRGLGVLAWFMRPGALAAMLAVGFVLLFAPVLGMLAALGFLALAITALGLGVGDTWADWRGRARSPLT
jgi:hypothetical protein